MHILSEVTPIQSGFQTIFSKNMHTKKLFKKVTWMVTTIKNTGKKGRLKSKNSASLG